MAPLVACGTASGPVADTVHPASTGDTVEADRVQAFLDARYRSSDVRYAFHTRAGQDIDCVDFWAEPGVRKLAAEGHPLPSIPKAPPVPERMRRRAAAARPGPEDDVVFHGQPDVHGNPEICPEGSVPEVRITAAEIAMAGGLDAFVHHLSHKGAPVRPVVSQDPSTDPVTACQSSQNQEYADYAHVVGTLVSGLTGVDYASDVMSVYGPNVPLSEYYDGTLYNDDHSLSEMWVYSGANTTVNGSACTSDCVQSIEVGWTVDPQLDTNDANVPHVFIFGTTNGYATGCYNNVGSCGPTWIPYAGAAAQLAPNAAIAFDPPANTGGQDPQAGPIEMSVSVLLEGSQYQVFVQIGSYSSEIGYYVSTDYSAPMDTVQVGGEVADYSRTFVGTDLQMGSGYAWGWGYGYSAYERDFVATSPGNVVESASLCATRPNLYGVSPLTASPNGEPGEYFTYGGTPGSTCTPTTCSAQGASCGTISNGCNGTLGCGSCRLPGESCVNNACVKTCRGKICPG